MGKQKTHSDPGGGSSGVEGTAGGMTGSRSEAEGFRRDACSRSDQRHVGRGDLSRWEG